MPRICQIYKCKTRAPVADLQIQREKCYGNRNDSITEKNESFQFQIFFMLIIFHILPGNISNLKIMCWDLNDRKDAVNILVTIGD